MTPSGHPTSAEGYELLEKIGKGASATVWRARVRSSGEFVAIKILNLEDHASNMEEIRKEIAIMRMSNHSNVTKNLASFVTEHTLWLVMPLLVGSCLDIMRMAFPDGLDETAIAFILKETLKGLEYFHKNNQIHRDIKAGNILIAEDGTVQVSDFGVAGMMVEQGQRRDVRQSFVGTPCWMAPEVMEQAHGYNYKADIWSFGITALELAHGKAPFSKFQPMKIMVLILRNPPPTLENDEKHKFSKAFKEVVDACMKKDPAQRPSATELLKFKFFKSTKKPDYIAQNILSKLPPMRERYARFAAARAASSGPDAPPEEDDPFAGTGLSGRQKSAKDYARDGEDDLGWDFDDNDIGKGTALPPLSVPPPQSAPPASQPMSPTGASSGQRKGRFLMNDVAAAGAAAAGTGGPGGEGGIASPVLAGREGVDASMPSSPTSEAARVERKGRFALVDVDKSTGATTGGTAVKRNGRKLSIQSDTNLLLPNGGGGLTPSVSTQQLQLLLTQMNVQHRTLQGLVDQSLGVTTPTSQGSAGGADRSTTGSPANPLDLREGNGGVGGGGAGDVMTTVNTLASQVGSLVTENNALRAENEALRRQLMALQPASPKAPL